MKTILAPIDFSPVSEAVVAQASSLARALSGKVVLMTVIQPPPMVAEYGPLLENIGEITAAGEKNAARELAKLETQLNTEDVPTETIVLVGAPIPHVIEQAARFSADYIVMGSHGHTAIYDLLVGSTTHGILMRAKCPVVIVPAVKAAKERKAVKEHQTVA